MNRLEEVGGVIVLKEPSDKETKMSVVNHHSFDTIAQPDEALIEFAVYMVSSYGLLERFRIPAPALRLFFQKVFNHLP